LKLIEPNILDGLNNLEYVNFAKNTNYNSCYSLYPVYEPNSTLDELKADLYENFYAKFPFLEDLKQEVQNLKETKVKVASLEETIENLKTQSFLSSDVEAFIQDESTKDFKIIIEGQEFPVHKFLLAARSPTLAELLKNNPEVENLNLVDISVEIFEKILKFLYTDELPGDDGTNFLHLFAAAGKLKIEELKNYAAAKIIDKIDPENAFEVLNQSHKYKVTVLWEKAFEEIKKKYKNIEIKDEWAKEPEKLLRIVQNFKLKEDAKRKYEEEIRKLDEQFESSMIN
jgi:hypothetical protein